MSSTRRATVRVRRRLSEYNNVNASDIDIERRESPVVSTIDFYFERLESRSKDDLSMLDEWRRSSIVVMDGWIAEWTLHLPIIYPPFDSEGVESEWDRVYDNSGVSLPVSFYVSEYDGIGVPHVDTPEEVWSNNDVNFSVVKFFDKFDSVVHKFADRIYDEDLFIQ